MIIALLESKALKGAREGETATEVGKFTLDVKIADNLFMAILDKKKAIKDTVALHLASAIDDTHVPANMWLVRFPPKIQREFSFPETLDMDINNL